MKKQDYSDKSSFKKEGGKGSDRNSGGRSFGDDSSKRPRRDSDGGTEKRTYNKRGDARDTTREKRTYKKREEGSGDRPYGEKREYKKRFDSEPSGERKSYKKREDSGGERPYGEKREYKKRFDSDLSGERKSYKKREDSGDRPYGEKREYKKRFDSDQSGERKSYKKREDSGDRPYGEKKEYKKRFDSEASGEKRSYKRREEGDKPFAEKRAFNKDKADKGDRPAKKANRFGEETPFYQERKKRKEDFKERKSSFDDQPREERAPRKRIPGTSRPERADAEERRDDNTDAPVRGKKQFFNKNREIHDDDDFDEDGDGKFVKETFPMMLNKFIAHAGVCGRREAAELVKQGKVTINGEPVLEPGHRVVDTDKVVLGNKRLTLQKHLVYILLNKPKGFITTTDDPKGRKKVMDMVANAGVERLFPVGRLDRNTTGVLLITNDGDLAQRLSHPSHKMKKIYQVTLDKHLTKADFDKILAGVELEDGKAPVDELSYLEEKNEIGIEIHSGKNRIVRRIFEHLGYEVTKLDRVVYAGLTKKNVSRGKWRFLDEREVILLKHFKS